MYKLWQKIGTIGGIISLISGLLFIYLIYLQFKNKKVRKIEYIDSFIPYELKRRTLDEILPYPYHLYPNSPILIKYGD